MSLDLKKTYMKRATGMLVAIMCVALIPMVSLASGFTPLYEPEPVTFATDLAFYAGAFSTAVTASINPTATMAVLAILILMICSVSTVIREQPIFRSLP